MASFPSPMYGDYDYLCATTATEKIKIDCSHCDCAPAPLKIEPKKPIGEILKKRKQAFKKFYLK